MHFSEQKVSLAQQKLGQTLKLGQFYSFAFRSKRRLNTQYLRYKNQCSSASRKKPRESQLYLHLASTITAVY